MDNDVRKDWQLKDHVDQLSADAKGFLNTKVDEWVLTASERFGILSARSVMLLVGLALGGMVMLFTSFALAYWLGVQLENVAVGYLCVAGIYLVLTFLFWLLWKHALRKRIILGIVNEIYNDDDENGTLH